MSWEEVYKKNLIEKIKRDKHPFKLLEELETLARRHYSDIPEEEFIRLYWLGVVHDRPRTGYLMLRLRIPGGILKPHQLRRIGELSYKYGKNYAEITVRQDIQLHWIELKYLPEVLAQLKDVGILTIGTEGDTVRNITTCPLAGLTVNELFDVRDDVYKIDKAFLLDPIYADLPRKFKITITACPYMCSVPEIQDLALIGVTKDGKYGYTVLIGGGLSLAPRVGRHMSVFVPREMVIEFVKAVLDVWREEPRYRLSRVRARIKFMIDDLGVDKFRELVENRLGQRLEDYPSKPESLGKTDHIGVERLKDGTYAVGVAIPAGIVTGEFLIKLADLAEAVGVKEVRLTQRQNLILAGVPEDKVEIVKEFCQKWGYAVEQTPLVAMSVACTGDPYCNYSISDTKGLLLELIKSLKERFGEIQDLPPIHIVGCPHACAWYWIGNIGLMATTAKMPDGRFVKAYDVLVGGDYGKRTAIGKVLFKKVPADKIKDCITYLVEYYINKRAPGEDFPTFIARIDLRELADYISDKLGVQLALGK